MLAAAVSKERAQQVCFHDRMVWEAFLPQVLGLAHVRSTRARPPVPAFGPRGAMRYGRFGGPLSV